MGRSQEVTNGQTSSGGMDKVDPGVVARDIHVAIGVCPQSTSERREVRESLRETQFEERDKGINGDRRAGEEATLLDVVDREHGKV